MDDIPPREREEIISRLEDLGLTKNEARVYYALVRLGEAKASEIAKNSGVAREKTYRILRGLTSKGMARLVGGKPQKWRAEEPAKIFMQLLEEKRRRVEKEEWAIQVLEKIFESAMLKKQKREIVVWEVGERDTVDLLKELIENSRENIFLLLSPIHLDRFTMGEFKDSIKKANKKESKIKLISWMVEDNIFLHAKLDYYTDLMISETKPLTRSYIIVDEKEGIILDKDGVGIHISNERVASTVASLLKCMSECATPLRHYIKIYDATNRIPPKAPITQKNKLEMFNRILENMTAEVIRRMGIEPVYNSLLNAMKQVFPEYDRMTLNEKIKLYKTLMESTYDYIQVEGSIDERGAKIIVTVEIEYDGEIYKRIRELVRRTRLYPHPYIVGIEGEIRREGYPVANTLLTDYKKRNKLQILRLYTKPRKAEQVKK